MRPSEAHEARVAKMKVLAGLTGHTVCLTQLPDGRRPDLLATNPTAESWLIGDAKHTESPSSVATWSRLDRYFEWVESVSATGIRCAFLLCCPTARQSQWAGQLRELLLHHPLGGWTVSGSSLGDGDAVLIARDPGAPR